MAFLTEKQLNEIGFAALGSNVLISDKASIYGAQRIKIGNNVRIDDFCVISAGKGGIEIGNYVHVAVFALLIGNGKITLSDFSGVSSRVSIYSSNDDYSGGYLTNPTVPSEYTNVKSADVTLMKHVIIGSGSVVLPGVTLHEGAAVGSLSMISKDCEAFGIYIGSPAKKIKRRNRNLLNLELEFQDEKMS
ncbi:TPA: acyltransferase [Vibrio vulnificus]|nr:acyltransferase [Vibrio vulnificus]HDY7944581.1 acyltransferase [Vibrio vulnificus]